MSVPDNLKNIVEAALLAAGRALSLEALQNLFNEIECPTKKELRAALEALAADYQGRGIEVVEVSSGWRVQVGKACSPWVSRLWDEKPARYSRALMETLALIAYRQPITRGEIEDIRGVSVSTNIVKTLMEREWVRVVGQRDVPGRPSLYGTTREFLDYFGLKSLDELPTLAELTGAKAPGDIDGISILPEILGTGKPAGREMLYFEFGRQVAVRFGDWKAIQPKTDAPWELYDLDNDRSESNDLATQHPEIVKRLEKFWLETRTVEEDFPVPDVDGKTELP